MIRHKLKFILIFLFCQSFCSFAAVPPSKQVDLKLDTQEDRNHTSQVKAILKKHGISEDQLGVSVHELKTNKTFFNHRETDAHIPASVTKLFTTFFALNVLPHNHTFKTTLAHTGKIKENQLEGDLLLIGGGDPYLTNEKLLNLAMSLKEKGIYKVKGNFYYVESIFPFLEKISLVGLDDHTYNSAVSGLSSDFNRIRIIRGKDDRFTTLPKLSFIEIDETKEALGPGEKFQRDYLVSLSKPKTKTEQGIVVERWFGSKKQRYARVEEIPIRSPGVYTASMLDFYAKQLNIQLPFPRPLESYDPKATVIATVKSPELLQLCKLALYYSNNLIAESLLFHAAQKLTGKKPNNFIAAARVMEAWIKKKYPRLDLDTFKLQNGSGLSSANVVSSDDLTTFLQLINKAKFNDTYFWTILAASAHSGFLRKKYVNNETGLKIWAKTGSLDYVNNIAGYFFGNSGQNFSFSIMFQDLDGRKVVDGPNSKKAEKFRQKAKKWRRQTQKATEEILEYLIKNL